MSFCGYCGDDLSDDDTCVVVGEGSVHIECRDRHIPKRNEALKKIADFIPIRHHILCMGIHVSYLYGPGSDNRKDKKSKNNKNNKKQQRILKLDELLHNVTALRNSCSGAVLIHVVGLELDDSFTGAFDQFADQRLNEIIHDGKLFFNVYKKEVLSVHDHFEGYNDFVLLFVEGDSYLTTYDFNTKVSLDDSIIGASEVNVRRFLKERKDFEEEYHVLEEVTCFNDLLRKQENRSLQFKSNCSHPQCDADIVAEMFSNLKLSHYISAFTKNENGGSFIFGITEENFQRRFYTTKVNSPQPAVVGDLNQLKILTKVKAKEYLLVCDYEGNEISDTDIVDVHFIPSTSGSQEGAIQVTVRPVRGIVFQNREGPLAYTFDRNRSDRVSKLELKTWFDLFFKRN